jgi:hypothetical protein
LKGFEDKDLALLSLGDTMITDAGLNELSELKSTHHAGFSAELRSTDAGLKELSGLAALKKSKSHEKRRLRMQG